jgi:hypothetical protein
VNYTGLTPRAREILDAYHTRRTIPVEDRDRIVAALYPDPRERAEYERKVDIARGGMWHA